MIPAMVRLLVAVGFGAFIVLFVFLPLRLRFGVDSLGWPENAMMARLGGLWPAVLLDGVLLSSAALIATWALFHVLRKLKSVLDANAVAQRLFLDTLDSRYIDAAIVVSTALSLFLELALIRWQSSVLEFLAFYKNFSLLACFAGLGLGYALAARDRIPLLMVVPLLGAQFCFFLFVRLEFSFLDSESTAFEVNPFREQLAMGMSPGNWFDALGLFLLLSVIFLLTALTFVPIGQLCGRLMERRKNLRAYGLNLIGSLLGVVMMLVASLLWTPPLVWFALCFLGVLLLHFRQPSPLVAGIVFSIICTIILAWWPLGPLWSRVYSPYQLVEIGTDSTTGLTLIRASGHYYQHILDLSSHHRESSHDRDYYDFPYKAHPVLNNVAIIGSGTGNDVAAAVRAGAGRVDAIEIDPVILLVGKERHPEKPYANPRVRPVNNDARSFLRGTEDKYDLIVYGLLDSHTLLSQGSSVRLDSFVYTIEGLREARNLLKPDGMISLSFTVLSEAMGRKIYLMMQQVFDGRAPLCVARGLEYDLSDLERSELAAPREFDGRERQECHGEIRQFIGTGQRLHGRLAVLLHAAAHLSHLLRDHDRFDFGSLLAAGGELRCRNAATRSPVVLLSRRRLHAGRNQGDHRDGINLREYLAGCRYRVCRHPDYGFPWKLSGSVPEYQALCDCLSFSLRRIGRGLAIREVRRTCVHSDRPTGDRRVAEPAAPVLGNCVLDIAFGPRLCLRDHGDKSAGGHRGWSIGVQFDVFRFPSALSNGACLLHSRFRVGMSVPE